MFSLLVGIDPQQGSAQVLRFDRILEYTEQNIREKFLVNGALLRDVLKFPAILMPEEDRGKPHYSQLAYVGRVTDFTQQTGGLSFRVAPDPLIPPIPIPTLRTLHKDFGMAEFEFHRTHWALKEVDLFEVLFRHSLQCSPKPRIVGIDHLIPVDPDQVSVMIRFRADFDQVFDAVKQASESLAFRCQRVKDIWEKDAIITDITSLIMRSRVVVADLTDRNANVFYECGLAHGIGREVVPITQDAADNFDVQHLRHVVYQNTVEGRERLTHELLARLRAIRDEH